jgi:hypothetical protein
MLYALSAVSYTVLFLAKRETMEAEYSLVNIGPSICLWSVDNVQIPMYCHHDGFVDKRDSRSVFIAQASRLGCFQKSANFM